MRFSDKMQYSDVRRAKQEKNLRRRVYDSLNVLLAVGVLKKDGKYVKCNYPAEDSDGEFTPDS